MAMHPVLTRRRLVTTGLALLFAPAIVRATSIMPVKMWREPLGRWLHSLEGSNDRVNWFPIREERTNRLTGSFLFSREHRAHRVLISDTEPHPMGGEGNLIDTIDFSDVDPTTGFYRMGSYGGSRRRAETDRVTWLSYQSPFDKLHEVMSKRFVDCDGWIDEAGL